MGEPGAEHDRGGFHRFAVRERRGEIAVLAIELRYGGLLVDGDKGILFHSVDHAADGVLGPLARGHQLGIAGQDRGAAQAVHFLDQHDLAADRGDAVRGGKSRRPGADHEDGVVHSVQALSASSGL